MRHTSHVRPRHCRLGASWRMMVEGLPSAAVVPISDSKLARHCGRLLRPTKISRFYPSLSVVSGRDEGEKGHKRERLC